MVTFDSDLPEDEDHLLSPLEDELEDSSQIDETGTEDREDELEKAWEKRQRELITSVLDYNLSTLSDLITNKQIDLSPRYQRRDRWKPPRQSMLIESFLMNVPIPPIFLNEDNYGTYSVIDGKQRLTAIHQFMRGRLKLQGLKVFQELNGKTIDDLSANFRNVIATRSNLRATIILRQSDNDVKFEVFRRLNTGGVRLNAQEIRNSTWPGPLNDLLLDLSETPIFQSLVGIVKPESSTLYKEMRDVELVLRFMTFRTSWQTFKGGMSRKMDEFMAENQRPGKPQLDAMRSDFVNALNVVHTAFDQNAFRRFTPETGLWRKPILAALFDAQMLAAREYSPDEVSPCSADIQDGNMELFSDPNFRRTIDAATNTPALFQRRIEFLQELFGSIV
jgi:hypothetical protein